MCRTYNGSDINAEPGVNSQTKDGRGNICPVTIILPTLAMEALSEYYSPDNNKDQTVVDIFMKILDQKISEAKDMLLERYHYICSQTIDGAKFMYENNLILGYDGKTVESAMRHGTLAVGL